MTTHHDDPEPDTRRAPLTLERARSAAATLAAVAAGEHPGVLPVPGARTLATAKLRELLEETGGELVAHDPGPLVRFSEVPLTDPKWARILADLNRPVVR